MGAPISGGGGGGRLGRNRVCTADLCPQEASSDQRGTGAEAFRRSQQARRDWRPCSAAPNQLRILIRSTLLALNQANLTGNYTVLRDLGAPGFQQANSPARLGRNIGGLTKRGLDLDPIVVIEPKLLQPASINNIGHLRLRDSFRHGLNK